MKKIFCAGSFVIDIYTGLINKPVKPGGGVLSGIEVLPGGNAFNVSACLAGLGFPGGGIKCFGTVGDDNAAGFIKDAAEKLGIGCNFDVIKGGNTAKSIILKFKEERSFIVDKGHNKGVPEQKLISGIKKDKPGIVYIGDITGFGKESSKAVKTARSAGVLTYVDHIITGKQSTDILFSSAEGIDILHCNDYEASEITGQTNPRRAVKFLMERGFRVPVITFGGSETVFGFDGEVYSVPVFDISCADATGAGDAFAAGLIKKTADGHNITGGPESFINAVVFGHAAGAACAAERGPARGVNIKNVNTLMTRFGSGIAQRARRI